MQYRYLTLLVVSLNFTHGIDIPNIIEKFTSILHFNQAERSENSIIQGLKKYFLNDNQDESDKEPPDNEPLIKDLALRSMPSKLTGIGSKAKKIKTPSPATPLPSSLKNRRLWQSKKKGTPSSSSSEVEELEFFMDDWREKRLLLKFEALNSTEPRGDVVNMKSASKYTITNSYVFINFCFLQSYSQHLKVTSNYTIKREHTSYRKSKNSSTSLSTLLEIAATIFKIAVTSTSFTNIAE